MMREILFRGKRTYNGEWVEGSLIIAENYCCILQAKEKVHFMDYPYLDGELGTIDGQATPVLPETVGQYTGLTDKNGNKIFEDDIVKVTDDNGEMNMCSCGIGYVLFYDGSWYIDDEVNDGLYDVSKIYYIEVIGNIHDNPELLKGGEQ